MLKHIVMWKLKDYAQGNSKEINAKIMKEKLVALKEIIPLVITLSVGIDTSNTPSSYDVVLYSEFKDQKDLENYAKDPNHLKVVEFINQVKSERILVDYNE